MSEQILKEQVMVETTKHVFHCDDCGALILESIEDTTDGWYLQPPMFRVGTMTLTGHYCDNCGNKRVKDIKEYLRVALNPHNKLKEE